MHNKVKYESLFALFYTLLQLKKFIDIKII